MSHFVQTDYIVLADNVCDVDLKVEATLDPRGRSAAHLAAIRNNVEALEELIEEGADVLARDHQGNTPLHYCGHVQTIDMLINHGANIHLSYIFVKSMHLFLTNRHTVLMSGDRTRNKHGDLPIDLMRRRGVDGHVVSLMEGLLSGAASEHGVPPDTLPLLHGTAPASRPTHRKTGSGMWNIWCEFCLDLGPERLTCVILAVLGLSVYVAYIVTEFAKHIDTRVPITVGSHNVELK